MERYDVLSPEGAPAVRQGNAAPRLPDLNGKAVGEVWNGVFKGDITFGHVRALLKERYPGVRIVPYTEFPHGPASDQPAQQRERARQIATLAKEKGCEALISGNGA